MQSSSQYYSDYLSHKADVMKCDQDMRTLTGIKNSLSGDFSVDSKLNDAVINLENEIADLNNKRSMADQQANQSYQDFLTAQREEHEAWLNSLRNRW